MEKEKQYFLTSFVGVAAFWSLRHLLINYTQFWKDKKTLKQAKATESFSVSQLDKAINNQDPSVLKNFKPVEGNSTDIQGRVFLEGTPFLISEDQPIYSKSSRFFQQTPLIYRVTYQQEVYSLDKKIEVSKSIYNLKHFPENSKFEKLSSFYLVDQQQKASQSESRAAALIQLGGDTDIIQCLQFIGSIDHLRRLTFTEWLMNIYLIIAKFFMLGVFSGEGNPVQQYLVKGFHLGHRDIEVGIKLEQSLSVYADVIYDLTNKIFKIKNPIALTSDKSQYLKKLQKQCEDSKYLVTLFSIIFTFCGVYLARRFYVYRKKLLEERIQQIRAPHAKKV